MIIKKTQLVLVACVTMSSSVFFCIHVRFIVSLTFSARQGFIILINCPVWGEHWCVPDACPLLLLFPLSLKPSPALPPRTSPPLSSCAIMFFWADKCVLPAKPVAISRRATQPLGATSDRADIDGGWMSASGGGGSTSKRWPVLVPSVIHHTYPPSAAGWLGGMAKIKKVDVTRQWEWRSSPAKLSILVGGSSSAQITLNFLSRNAEP